jgi:hypothetical protein
MIELDVVIVGLLIGVLVLLVLYAGHHAERRALQRRAERERMAHVYRRPDGFLVRSHTLALTCQSFAEAQAVADWANDPDDVRSLDMVRLPWAREKR